MAADGRCGAHDQPGRHPFRGIIFIAPELNGLVGERVGVRYTPNDLRRIELFRSEVWLCTAVPQGLLSREVREAVLDRRREDAAELRRRQRRAGRRARATLAPITGPGPAVETTVITAAQAAAGDTRSAEQRLAPGRGRGDRDRDLRRMGSTSLLALHDDFAYWNPAPADAPVDFDAAGPGGAG